MPQNSLQGLKQLLAFIDFGLSDQVSLAGVADVLNDELPNALDVLYRRIEAEPELAPVFSSTEQMRCARRGQEGHWRKMLTSDFQDGYIDEMRRIGKAHADVGVKPNWLIGAYAILLGEAFATLDKRQDPQKSASAKSALLKLFMIDIYYAVAVYQEEMGKAHFALEQQRERLMSEQAEVLDVLKTALGELHRGNLDHQIRQNLPSGFALAAEQFNAAIKRQRQLVRTVERRVTRDPLTGLLSRDVFFRPAKRPATARVTLGRRTRLEALDLDGFKLVNDTLGHQAGDHCLKIIAARLKKAFGRSARIFRLGGDEFAVVRRLKTGSDDENFYHDVIRTVAAPIEYCGTAISLGVSIGYVDYHRHACDDLTELLRKADLALYEAKRSGKGQATMFVPELLQRALDDSNTIRECKAAVQEGRLRLYYQPKVELATGRLVGLEALIRIVDQQGELKNAASFSAALADGACQRLVGDFVVDAAISAIRRLRQSGIEFGHVAINVATLQFASPSIVDTLRKSITDGRLHPADLQIEVTEDVILSGTSLHIDRALHELAELGIKIALDDFGTGYASLSHLQKFPIHAVKIDRSFVQGLASSPHNLQITGAVIALARSLNKEVVAEGIDNKDDANLLVSLGCAIGQGFLFSQAVPLEEIKCCYPGATGDGISDAA